MKRLSCLAGLLLLLSLELGAEPVGLRAYTRTNSVVLEIDLSEGFYSYLSSPWSVPLSVTAPRAYERVLGLAVMPQGMVKDDELIFKGRAEVVLPIMPETRIEDLEGLELVVSYQICDEVKKLCLSPTRETIPVALDAWKGFSNPDSPLLNETALDQIAPAQTPATETVTNPAESLGEGVARLVAENLTNPLLAFLLALLGGLLASLTPCVYPVIPVTLAFFASRGQTEGESRLGRRLSSALAYVSGMSLVYTGLGLVAGLIGGAFGAFVNTPVFLALLALLFIALALSLFDFWEFRLPRVFDRLKSRPKKSGLLSAFLMGGITGLVASPCVGPIVFFILSGVIKAGDPLYGAYLMLGFSLGIGILFLVLALLGQGLAGLPKSGNWMIRIKLLFGALVLGSGLYFLDQALGGLISPRAFLVGSILLVNLILILAWLRLEKLYGPEARLGPVLALVLSLTLVGFFALSDRFDQVSLDAQESQIDWIEDLGEGFRLSRESDKPVFVDVGARWCAVCRELSSEFKKNRAFGEYLMGNSIPVYLDYDRHKDLLSSYGVISLPWVMLLDKDGQLLWSQTGFDEPARLLSEISNLFSGRD